MMINMIINMKYEVFLFIILKDALKYPYQFKAHLSYYGDIILLFNIVIFTYYSYTFEKYHVLIRSYSLKFFKENKIKF